MKRIIILALCLSLFSVQAFGQTTKYCSPSGGGSGNDFTSLMTLPDTTGFTRGWTYIIVDGSYGSKTLSTPISSTTTITIKMASSSDSAITGYSSTLHDGQANFGSITITTGYWVINGVTRTETTRMEEPAGYGIRVTSIEASGYSGYNATGSQISYVQAGGTWSAADTPNCGTIQQRAAYLTLQTNMTFTRCAFHNAGAPDSAIIMAHGSSGLTFNHCDFYMGWGKATIATPNDPSDNMTVKYCRFWNSSRRDDWCGSTGEGLTCEVGSYSTGEGSTHNNNLVYGSIFYNTASGGRNSSVQWGDTTSSGGTAVNCLAYNNTFAGFPEDSVFSEVLLYAGSGNVARNNLFYDVLGTPSVTANTISNNVEVSSNPFVDYANRDFRLSAHTVSGYTLPSPFNVDMAGNTRTTWDLGAYEYAGTTPPSAQGCTISGGTFK